MKKIVFFLLACITADMRCMEQPAPTDIELESGSFARWPDELIMHLFAFVPEASSMKEIFNKLAQLSLVNRKFQQIAEDTVLLNELAKRYIESHQQEAEKEFRDAIDHILKDDSPQDYNQIVAALACNINGNVKNQALLDSIKLKNTYLAKLLVDFGADVNSADSNGATALLHASCNRSKKIVKLLLNKGANINTAANLGTTPLMWASCMDNKRIVQLLLDSGADVNAVCKNGSTAFSFASDMGAVEIAKLLKDHANALKDESLADQPITIACCLQ